MSTSWFLRKLICLKKNDIGLQLLYLVNTMFFTGLLTLAWVESPVYEHLDSLIT